MLDFYQALILEHHKKPHNYQKPLQASHMARRKNRVCGDLIEVSFEINDGLIKAASFDGEGCAISRASASLLTEKLEGLEVAQASEIIHGMEKAFASNPEGVALDDLELRLLFEGVGKYPARIKCALLPWEAARGALEA